MSEQAYREMVEVMSRRGAVFGGMDIPEFYQVVKALFTPDEAEINNAMPPDAFTAAELAKAMGRDEAELAVALKQMADKGLCNTHRKGDLRMFRAAPFVPGIFEFVMMRGTATERDKELARFIKEYKDAWEARSPIVIPYPMQRVIPVEEKIEARDQVHTYDQVKTYIEENDKIAVATCYCRHAASLRGEDTHGMPMQACFSFGQVAEYTVECLGARQLTKEEAKTILDKCEEAGLVHMTHNVTDGVSYLCNCDKWHCFAVQIALKQPKPSAVFNSGFEPGFDPDGCTGCEICIDRCPATALAMGEDDVPIVDLDRCFGCAACATGCPDEAVSMVEKAGHEPPPKDNNELMKAMFASFSR